MRGASSNCHFAVMATALPTLTTSGMLSSVAAARSAAAGPASGHTHSSPQASRAGNARTHERLLPHAVASAYVQRAYVLNDHEKKTLRYACYGTSGTVISADPDTPASQLMLTHHPSIGHTCHTFGSSIWGIFVHLPLPLNSQPW